MFCLYSMAGNLLKKLIMLNILMQDGILNPIKEEYQSTIYIPVYILTFDIRKTFQ